MLTRLQDYFRDVTREDLLELLPAYPDLATDPAFLVPPLGRPHDARPLEAGGFGAAPEAAGGRSQSQGGADNPGQVDRANYSHAVLWAASQDHCRCPLVSTIPRSVLHINFHKGAADFRMLFWQTPGPHIPSGLLDFEEMVSKVFSLYW